MTMRFLLPITFLLLLLTIFLVSCSAPANADGAAAVEVYFQALVAKDENRLINSTCAASEADRAPGTTDLRCRNRQPARFRLSGDRPRW